MSTPPVVTARMAVGFSTVDAYLRFWLLSQYVNPELSRRRLPVALRWEYEPLTSGSSRHSIRDPDKRRILVFTLSAIGHEQTLIGLHSEAAGTEEELQLILGNFYRDWQQYLHEVVDTMAVDIATLPTSPTYDDTAPPVPLQRRPAGRQRDPDNEWAREQISSGVERNTVYRAWLERKGMSDENSARDLFRKLMPRRKTGRNK